MYVCMYVCISYLPIYRPRAGSYLRGTRGAVVIRIYVSISIYLSVRLSICLSIYELSTLVRAAQYAKHETARSVVSTSQQIDDDKFTPTKHLTPPPRHSSRAVVICAYAYRCLYMYVSISIDLSIYLRTLRPRAGRSACAALGHEGGHTYGSTVAVVICK